MKSPAKIVIEAETPDDSASLFRLLIDERIVGESLTAAQAHLLVGEILGRVALPSQPPSTSSISGTPAMTEYVVSFGREPATTAAPPRHSAREALKLAEVFLASDLPNVIVRERATNETVSFEELRKRAAQERPA